MSDQGGRWVEVRRADGIARTDWRPDEQPPSPDGSRGSWHVVTADGEPSRWEWVPLAVTPAPPAHASPPRLAPSITPEQDSGPRLTAPARTRGALFAQRRLRIGGAVGLGAVALLVGTLAAAKILGGDQSTGLAEVIDPVSGAALRPGQPSSAQVSEAITASFAPFQTFADHTGTLRGSLAVSLTNNSGQMHFFNAEVTAKSTPQGTPIHQETLAVGRLPAGQTATLNFFTRAPSHLFEALSGATFDIEYISVTEE